MSAPAPAQSVVITGAGRGIGRAIALDLAERSNMQLMLVSQSENALNTATACNQVRAGSARGFVWDITTSGQPREQLLRALSDSPAPRALVHAAAVLGPTGPFADNDIEKWWQAMEVNLGGSVRLVHGVLPLMRGEGRIVLFSGGGAAYGYPGFSSYGTAKAALVRFTETLAMELGDEGPIVTIVAPGANETDMLAQVRAAGGEVKTTVSLSEPCQMVRRLLTEDTRGLHGRFLHVRDTWTADGARELPEGFYKLRRVDGR